MEINFLENYNILDKIYPVGAVYISVTLVNPKELFGGEWEQIQDRFLLACGAKYSNGSTGGEEKHTLTVSEIPAHSHNFLLDSDSSVHTWIYPTCDNSVTNKWGNEFSTPPGYSAIARGYSITNTGGSQSHNNMPPYLAVYMWKRIS